MGMAALVRPIAYLFCATDAALKRRSTTVQQAFVEVPKPNAWILRREPLASERLRFLRMTSGILVSSHRCLTVGCLEVHHLSP
jgi:hypothetical protein